MLYTWGDVQRLWDALSKQGHPDPRNPGLTAPGPSMSHESACLLRFSSLWRSEVASSSWAEREMSSLAVWELSISQARRGSPGLWGWSIISLASGIWRDPGLLLGKMKISRHPLAEFSLKPANHPYGCFSNCIPSETWKQTNFISWLTNKHQKSLDTTYKKVCHHRGKIQGCCEILGALWKYVKQELVLGTYK